MRLFKKKKQKWLQCSDFIKEKWVYIDKNSRFFFVDVQKKNL